VNSEEQRWAILMEMEELTWSFRKTTAARNSIETEQTKSASEFDWWAGGKTQTALGPAFG